MSPARPNKGLVPTPFVLGLCGFLASVVIALATSVPSTRFAVFDVFVNSHDAPLAAYQAEISFRNRSAKIVGIEGGEHAAFAQPPLYDPKAMQGERVIIAAFSTNRVANLPNGKTRVATIHVQTHGTEQLHPEAQLRVAGTAGGRKIQAEVVIQERHNP